MKNYQTNTGVFNILFQDCPAVKEKAQKTSVGVEGLVELLRSYHECRNVPYKEYMTKEYKTKKQRPSAHVGFFVGQTFSNFSIGKSGESPETVYLYNTNFESSFYPTLGAMALIGGRSPSSIFSFQSELTYTKADFKGSYTHEPAFGAYHIKQTSNTSVEYNKLSISAGLRITFRSNSLNPYLSFGLAGQQLLSLNESVHQVTTINDSVEEQDFKLGLKKSAAAVLVSAGLKKKVARNNALFVECNFEKTGISTDDHLSAGTSTVALRVGFLF